MCLSPLPDSIPVAGGAAAKLGAAGDVGGCEARFTALGVQTRGASSDLEARLPRSLMQRESHNRVRQPACVPAAVVHDLGQIHTILVPWYV